MKFLESDLEEIIFNANPDDLRDRGLWFYHTRKYRQLRIGNYGVADIVTFNRPKYVEPLCGFESNTVVVNVYELKKSSLSISAFFQAIRYCKGIKRWIEKKGLDEKFNFCFHIILIGREEPQNDLLYLPDIAQSELNSFDVSIYSYQYELNGLNFTEIRDYYLREEGFRG